MKKCLPQTHEEFKKLSMHDKTVLWARYVPHPFKRQHRALWYYIQCENLNLRIEPKHLTKIKKYKDSPNECVTRVYQKKYNLNPGAEIIKIFRGIEFKVLVADNGDFIYDGRTFKTLSAVARKISGIKISGPDFFGLNKRDKK